MEESKLHRDRLLRMSRQRRAGMIILLMGIALLIWTVPAQSESGVVVRVVDGDTLKVWISEKIQTVRLIGVDTLSRRFLVYFLSGVYSTGSPSIHFLRIMVFLPCFPARF